MNRTVALLALACFAMVSVSVSPILSGCASAERVVYKSTGVSAALGDKAFDGWRDYVSEQKRKGTPVSLDDERKVEAVYNREQKALVAMSHAGAAWSRAKKQQASDTDVSQAKQAFDAATQVFGAALGDLVDLVAQFGIQVE